jgi:hypothetical protein
MGSFAHVRESAQLDSAKKSLAKAIHSLTMATQETNSPDVRRSGWFLSSDDKENQHAGGGYQKSAKQDQFMRHNTPPRVALAT